MDNQAGSHQLAPCFGTLAGCVRSCVLFQERQRIAQQWLTVASQEDGMNDQAAVQCHSSSSGKEREVLEQKAGACCAWRADASL